MFVRIAKVNYFGRLKMEFTADIKEAGNFSSPTGIVDKICRKLKKVFGDDMPVLCLSEKTYVTARQPFYVIAVENDSTRQYLTGLKAKGLEISRDIKKAYISQSRLDIESVLTMARNNGVGKARVMEIYMNIKNTLQENNFVLIASGREGKNVLYVSSPDTARLCATDNLAEARSMGYDDAITVFEKFKASFPDMRFAVIQKPTEDVNASVLADYIKSHGNNNRIAISIKLRD